MKRKQLSLPIVGPSIFFFFLPGLDFLIKRYEKLELQHTISSDLEIYFSALCRWVHNPHVYQKSLIYDKKSFMYALLSEEWRVCTEVLGHWGLAFEGPADHISRYIGCGDHLRFKFSRPDLAPSKGKLSLYSPSIMTLVSVMMHLPM